MTTSSPLNLAVEQPSCSRPPAIRVVVGYPWTKAGSDRAAAPRSDKRWVSIRDCVTSVGDWVHTSISRRLPAPVPFVYEVASLRGTHGRMLLDNLPSRIEVVDDEGAIKIVDVHGFQAALRSAVLRKALQLNMIGPRKGPYAGPEYEHEDDRPPTPTGGGGPPNSAGKKLAKRRDQIGRTNK